MGEMGRNWAETRVRGTGVKANRTSASLDFDGRGPKWGVGGRV
jgi:hypothetical protein